MYLDPPVALSDENQQGPYFFFQTRKFAPNFAKPRSPSKRPVVESIFMPNKNYEGPPLQWGLIRTKNTLHLGAPAIWEFTENEKFPYKML